MSRRSGRFDCTRARELAALAPDGALTRLERAQLQRHAAACPSCAELAESAALVSLTLASTEPQPFTLDVDQVLADARARAAGAPGSRRRRRRGRRSEFLLGSAAGATAVAATSVVALWSSGLARQDARTPVATRPLIVVQAVDAEAELLDDVQALKAHARAGGATVTVAHHPGMQVE